MSTTTPTTALVINTKAAQGIKPPLKKNEIVHALALRKFQQLHAELKVRTDRRAELGKRINEEIAKLHATGGQLSHALKHEHLALVINRNPADRYTRHYCSINGVVVTMARTILLDDLPAATRQMIKELNKLNAIGDWIPEFAEIKRDIRDKMTGETNGPGARIEAMLKDPATAKALDKTLEHLAKPAVAA